MIKDTPPPSGRPSSTRSQPAQLNRPRRTELGPRLVLGFRDDAPLTDDLCNAPAAGNLTLRLERNSRGDLEWMATAGGEASRRNATLLGRLHPWAEHKGRRLGSLFDSSVGFHSPEGSIIAQDAPSVVKARWEALPDALRAGFVPFCPDFAVELRSQTDRRPVLRTKMRRNLVNVPRLGTLIEPIAGQVEIQRHGRAVETRVAPARLPDNDVPPDRLLGLYGILDT